MMLVVVFVGCGCLASAWWVFIGVDVGSGVMISHSKFMQIRGKALVKTGVETASAIVQHCFHYIVIISPH